MFLGFFLSLWWISKGILQQKAYDKNFKYEKHNILNLSLSTTDYQAFRSWNMCKDTYTSPWREA